MKSNSFRRVMMIMALFSGFSLHSQTVSDALRYSHVEYGGTARYMSMGGAFGALGGDFSVAGSNPAGLGLFRSSQFTFSPGFESITIDATSYGEELSENVGNLALYNIGIVAANEVDRGKWKYVNFTAGHRRQRTFHADEIISGRQDDSSLSGLLASNANGLLPDEFFDAEPFYIYPAYEAFIIDPLEGAPLGFYQGAVLEGQEVRQTTRIQSEGRSGETLLAMGSNYDDRLYLGVSLGFQRFIFEESFSFGEEVVSPDTAGISSFGYRQDLETTGDGFNIRLGAIYRFNDVVRLGASYTSPTWNTFETNFATSFTSNFTDGDSFFIESPFVGFSSYNIRSPHRIMGSLGLVIGKRGLLSVEYEHVDFGRMRFSDTNDTPIDFSGDNQDIRRIHVATGIVRAGGEVRFENVSLRAGYTYRPDPYAEDATEFTQDVHVINAGIGFRVKNTTIDLAYRTQRSSADFISYQDSALDTARLDFRQDIFVATLGYRF